MLSTIAYYLLYTSALFIYGIGLHRSLVLSRKPRHLLLLCIKMMLTVSSTAALSFVIVGRLFVPMGLTELYPFVAVILFSVISIFIEAIIRITVRRNAAEYAVSLLSVLLGINESVSLWECVVISCLCVLSFFLALPFLYAIRKRIEIASPANSIKNTALVIISLAALLIILFVWNVSWLNQGVL